MIIGLIGYAQSGKDTVAQILKERNFHRIAFADPIRKLAYDMNPMVDSIAGEPKFLKEAVDKLGWEEAKKNPHVRRVLQNLGVGARKHFGENFWVDQALKPVENYLGVLHNFVITDVRFKNEAEAIKNFPYGHSQLWRITRPGIEAVNNHVSELELKDHPVDREFINAGSIEDLRQAVLTYVNGVVLGSTATFA